MKINSFSLLSAVLAAAFVLGYLLPIKSQNLPAEFRISPDGRRLTVGNNASTGFYDESLIRTIELQFPQANYWNLLTQNYQSKTEIPATMTVDGVVYDSVGVRFKGQTSYSMLQNSQKKSFAVSLDYAHDNQDIMGYSNLNFNNGYLDHASMREVFYFHQSRKHIPSAKANFVWLKLNGQDWGIYQNVQNLDGDHIKEWFLSNNGTRWRGERTTGGGGGPGGGGPNFGAGTSSLNWLGADTALYKPHYTLKKANKPNPWYDLMKTCQVLNNTPANVLEDSVKKYLDLDRTLWFLASEILFTDDDSYVWKGGMDYFLYWDPETGRMTPLEYDGNTCMDLQFANQWSPFYRQTDTKYALMNKLFPVPGIRQRYVAHVRTIMEESFGQAAADSLIDVYRDLIDAQVQSDPKKIYTYAQFQDGVEELKDFIQARRTYVMNNAEINAPAPQVGDVEMLFNGQPWASPEAGQPVQVTAKASAAAGIEAVRLYYATGLSGWFERTQMFDDGQHGDGAASDGVFGGTVQAFPGGSYVRFYVEAVSANTYKTVAYAPKGAEHDVYFYRVNPDLTSGSDVVINELMAQNTNTATDANGEYEDWIELFNNGDAPADLGGWFLSDDPNKLAKWAFPGGAIVPAKGYLIVWADEDANQNGLHANFKLSATGENLYLTRPDSSVSQFIAFQDQIADKGYARRPNGTGSFVIQAPTFNANNDQAVGTDNLANSTFQLEIFPNPTSGALTVKTDLPSSEKLTVTDMLGRLVFEKNMRETAQINLRNLAGSGVFFVKVRGAVRKVVVE